MNRTRVRFAIFALPFVAFGVGLGCLGLPERSYFDDLIDGGADGTVVVVVDSSTDSSMPDAMGDDGQTGLDAGDAPIDADAGFDAPLETGCGPMNTVLNCGACGAACDTTRSSPSGCASGSCLYASCDAGWGNCDKAPPDTNGCETPINTTTDCTGCGIACDTTNSKDASCNGTTCTYASCAAGWSDCNSTPPNANGCECHSPGCCGDGSACEPAHDNGVGGTYYDCTPVGTYTSALAYKACTAYTGDVTKCVGFPCANPNMGPIVCSDGLGLTKPCMCWSYAGTNIGLVDNGGPPPDSGSPRCFCPTASVGDTNWN